MGLSFVRIPAGSHAPISLGLNGVFDCFSTFQSSLVDIGFVRRPSRLHLLVTLWLPYSECLGSNIKPMGGIPTLLLSVNIIYLGADGVGSHLIKCVLRRENPLLVVGEGLVIDFMPNGRAGWRLNYDRDVKPGISVMRSAEGGAIPKPESTEEMRVEAG